MFFKVSAKSYKPSRDVSPHFFIPPKYGTLFLILRAFCMRLSTLLQPIFNLPALADRDISQLILDSRKIQAQDLFFALQGTQLDGRHYIPDAISRGAAAVLIEADQSQQQVTWQGDVPLIPVPHLTKKVGEIAARFYDYPVKKMRVIGVTGTNGKTSCSHYIAQSLSNLQTPCGIIGTLGHGFYGALSEAGLTTPDPITLQAILQDFFMQGAKSVAMEVSSHSIAQERVSGIPFEIGIFTNLTQDHLDYHGDMETYAAVKHRFLAELPTKHLIINADDPHGKIWLELAKSKPVFAYALKSSQQERDQLDVPFVYADNVELTAQGIRAFVYSPWGEGRLTIPLIGEFNLSNALAVLSALCVYGVNFKDALTCLSRLQPVAGRMQTLGGGDKPLIVVDYAHSPDALEKVLQALRAHTQGKLICVFGCGGDRDHGKRPLMAKIVEKWADGVIVTNDNPRHEKPEAIAEQIMQGFVHPERVTVMLDRSKAIEKSIQWGKAKDCILIAGKGAERYQQIGDERIPFDDVSQVSSYLMSGEAKC